MGQYYRVYTKTRTGSERVFNTEVWFNGDKKPDWIKEEYPSNTDHYGCGCKLMEHSYMGNLFTTQFSMYLRTSDAVRLVWCGDYAMEDECKALGFEKSAVWANYKYEHRLRELGFDVCSKLYYTREPKEGELKYFINFSKKQYLDLEKYQRESSVRYEWADSDLCIYPISLLTTLGNDRGLGDFHKGYIGYESVGIWAGDFVTISEEVPEGFEEFTVRFIEKTED